MRRQTWIDVGIWLILGGFFLTPVVHLIAPGLDAIYFGVMPGIALIALGVLALVIGGLILLVRRARGSEPPVRIYEPPPSPGPAQKRRLWIDIAAIVAIAALIEFFVPRSFLLQAAPAALAVVAIIIRIYMTIAVQPRQPLVSLPRQLRRKMIWLMVIFTALSFAWFYYAAPLLVHWLDPMGKNTSNWTVDAIFYLPAAGLMTVAIACAALVTYSESEVK